jgi:hypothetical protein
MKSMMTGAESEDVAIATVMQTPHLTVSCILIIMCFDILHLLMLYQNWVHVGTEMICPFIIYVLQYCLNFVLKDYSSAACTIYLCLPDSVCMLGLKQFAIFMIRYVLQRHVFLPQGIFCVFLPQGYRRDTKRNYEVSQGYPMTHFKVPHGIPRVLCHVYIRYHKKSQEYSAMSI